MIKLDMIGQICPVPVVEAKKAIRKAAPQTEVHVLVDNDIARQNLQRMAQTQGCTFSYREEDGNILVTLTTPVSWVQNDEIQGTVVAIGKQYMGQGDDDLGGVLMKNFIYSLTELDPAPQAVLFFNGGVNLTVEGSASLDDLRVLEDKGTQVSSCGACLDFYKFKEKLAVGNVTNMYAITSSMAAADHLINL